jgi:acetate kinase
VIEQVAELRDLPPLHNGMAAATMTAGLATIPQLSHVVVFDTAFHATLPEEAFHYPVPEQWYRDWGVRRYGFHGISVAWSTERAAAFLGRSVGELRTVVAHLGSGCSVTAVDGGRSVSTSMGLTPLEGLMMGTRAGSIDPGALFYLLRTGRLSPDELAEQMDHESGLLGVSGRPPMCANSYASRRPVMDGRRWRSRCLRGARPNASLPRSLPCRRWTRSCSRTG